LFWTTTTCSWFASEADAERFAEPVTTISLFTTVNLVCMDP